MMHVGFQKQLEQWKREKERVRDYLRYSCGSNSQLNGRSVSSGENIFSQLTLVRTFQKFQVQQQTSGYQSVVDGR